jgi:tRNA A-37 threonylcarbamoyl transferase component Bud32/tetratricopeptide (TPR) repeat protein
MGCLTETTALAFVDGALAEQQRAEIEQHLAECPSCAELLAAIPSGASPAASLPRGLSVGRYVILGLVGRGAMGEVYAAYDPELDRKIALKLLSSPSTWSAPSESTAARGRLLREAKAIARLSHPNVVVVHDVGMLEQRVFLAMEFIDGVTLASWLAKAPRGWRDVLDRFVAAGRGLAAAHAAGIVHRDFKPQNVMVDGVGKVRVMDFGLARRLDDQTESRGELPGPAGVVPQPAGIDMDLALTRTGALLGTPRYMAPEQLLGAAADARSDQFSFCVALYEALYREHPFSSRNLSALTEGLAGGRASEPSPPARARVPSWLRRSVLRGLAAAPEQRFASMADLLEALARDPARRRRRAGAVAAAAALAIVAGLGFQHLANRERALCRSAPARLAGVWELPGRTPGPAARRAAVERAFLATGTAPAAEILQRLERALDRYVTRWIDVYTEACEATHVRGEQSEELLDRRMSCLGDRLMELRAVTDSFAAADAKVVAGAIETSDALGSLDRCSDARLLKALVQPPRSERVRASVEWLRAQALALKALRFTGRDAEALARSRPLVAQARALGYRPLVAEMLVIQGFSAYGAGKRAASADMFLAAWTEAEQCRDDEVAAEAAVMTFSLVAQDRGRHAEALRLQRLAESSLARLGRSDDRLAAWMLQGRALDDDNVGNDQAAVEHLQEAIALKQRALGPDDPDVGFSLSSLACSLTELGRFAECLEATDRAIALETAALGPESPRLGDTLNNRGECLNPLHRHAEAEADFRRSLAILERDLGKDHPNLAYPLTGLGISLVGQGKARAALAPLERALALRTRSGADPTVTAETQFGLATAVADARHDLRAAQALAQAARAAFAGAPGKQRRRSEVDAWLAAHGIKESRLGN